MTPAAKITPAVKLMPAVPTTRAKVEYSMSEPFPRLGASCVEASTLLRRQLMRVRGGLEKIAPRRKQAGKQRRVAKLEDGHLLRPPRLTALQLGPVLGPVVGAQVTTRDAVDPLQRHAMLRWEWPQIVGPRPDVAAILVAQHARNLGVRACGLKDAAVGFYLHSVESNHV